MRTAARTDGNHAEVVEALRAVGCSVLSLASMGKGVPDLLVHAGGDIGLVLMELKDGSLCPSARKLTPDQVKWHAAWSGPVHVVCSIREALAAVGVTVGREINEEAT